MSSAEGRSKRLTLTRMVDHTFSRSAPETGKMTAPKGPDLPVDSGDVELFPGPQVLYMFARAAGNNSTSPELILNGGSLLYTSRRSRVVKAGRSIYGGES